MSETTKHTPDAAAPPVAWEAELARVIASEIEDAIIEDAIVAHEAGEGNAAVSKRGEAVARWIVEHSHPTPPREAGAGTDEPGAVPLIERSREWWAARAEREGNAVVSAGGPDAPASTTPRRIQLNRLTAAERAIYDAVQVVESAGADVRLTDAVVLLQAARDSVADFVDGIESCRYVAAAPRADATRNAAPVAPCERCAVRDAEIMQVMEERDHYHEMADKLADAIVSLTVGGDVVEAIGEHSNLNDPWQNALDLADNHAQPHPDAAARDAALEFLRELGNGDFVSPFKRDPLEHANSHIAHIERRAKELTAALRASDGVGGEG